MCLELKVLPLLNILTLYSCLFKTTFYFYYLIFDCIHMIWVIWTFFLWGYDTFLLTTNWEIVIINIAIFIVFRSLATIETNTDIASLHIVFIVLTKINRVVTALCRRNAAVFSKALEACSSKALAYLA